VDEPQGALEEHDYAYYVLDDPTVPKTCRDADW
jgi:NAD-dependent DNA ligase